MKRWLKLWVLTCVLIYAECQEPDDATRKSQDELFKSKTTETTNTDINTTLSPTEIENNSTRTESTGSNDAGDATNDLDENDELSSTRDFGTNDEEIETSISNEETTTSSDWTTHAEDHEYPISIKDVFEKSIDVVKEEMKGIGIIQSWLKEQANDLIGESATPADEYMRTTDDYTNGMRYDDDQTGVPGEEKEQEENKDVEAAQQTEFDTKEENVTKAVKFLEQGDTLEKIENDLDKLQRVEAVEEGAVNVQKELIKEIEENLSKLEKLASLEVTTTDIDNVTNEDIKETIISDQNIKTTTTPTTAISSKVDEELVRMTENTKTTETLTDEQTTKISIEEDEIVTKGKVDKSTEKSEITTTLSTESETTLLIKITNELDSQEITTLSPEEESTSYDEVTIKIVAETTPVTDRTTEINQITETATPTVQSETSTVITTDSNEETTWETIVTTESPIITTMLILPITENPTTEAAIIETTKTAPKITTEVQVAEQENNEEVIIVTENNIDEDSKEKEYDSTVTERGTTETIKVSTLPLDYIDNSDELLVEMVDALEETQKMLTTMTSTESSFDILKEETKNLTETLDELLNKNEDEFKVMTSNSFDAISSREDSFNPSDNSKIQGEEPTEELGISLEVSANSPSQDIGNDDIITSDEEFDDLQKILIDVNRTEEDDTSDEIDQSSNTESEEEIDAKIVEPKLSVLITDEMDAICLNASGFSIKITTKNNTYWVPADTMVFGDCTSFGAYLNLTWRADGKEIRVNNTLSFTLIGDGEESYIEEVMLKTTQDTFIATQLERYFSNPTIINLSKDTTVTVSNVNIQLHRNKQDDYATISLLNVDNVLALQIASGGLCLFIVLIAVAIYSYRKLRSQARVFKVSLDK